MNARVRLALAVAAALGVVALGVGALGAGEEPETESGSTSPSGARFEGSVLPAGVRAPDFTLRDQDGEEIRMRDLRGRPAIVTFLYTHCDESCPPQAQQIKGALNELGRDVPALAIAVDPPRDTPDSAREFLLEQRMTGRMDFALGSGAELRPVWRKFAVRPQSEEAEHQARIVLVDRRGLQRVAFPLEQATPERIAHDVRALERE